MDKKVKDAIDNLKKFSKNGLFGKDFLLTFDNSKEDLKMVLEIAKTLRTFREHNISTRLFDSALAVSIFRDQSTRTRFSFASAVNLLGITAQDFDEKKSQVAHGETVRETANMISFMTEVIGIRDDMFIGEGNKYMREVAAAVTDGFEQGVLPVRPSLVNLQCDIDHPTQSMADLAFLENTYGSLDNLKGKKITMSWAYSPSYGKPLSVPQGIITLMTRFGMNVVLAHPMGYNLLPDTINYAKGAAKENGGSFVMTENKEEAFKDADIVYPKSWAPFHIMEQRTKLLQKGDDDGLKKLEKTCLQENEKFIDWEYNAKLKKLTKGGKAHYMHCLPADISGVSCKHGEVSAEVFEAHRIATYKEASWKPYIIAAMIFASKVANPSKKMAELVDLKHPRAY